ncbi:MAG TPA: carboxypeptidase-like regulatory domain-containing protein [Thermoanaerobaculia bacterium]|nr:carboxypeptidase-like regulatory domain-containing protein [Thermoanaerobaculia bacterium]
MLVAAALVTLAGLTGLSGAARAAAPRASTLSDARSAVLSGRVADAAGPLSGARVVARNTADGGETSTSTAADGTFEFQLPAGVYQLEARLDGLRFPVETGVRLASGDRRQIAIEGEAYYAAGALSVPLGRMELLARQLDDEHGDLNRLLAEAQGEIRRIYRVQELELAAASGAPAAAGALEKRVEAEVAAVEKKLRQRFHQALAGRRRAAPRLPPR